MVITHNLASTNAFNKLSVNTKHLAGVSEKLSSGYRINRSADDASGLAVSEKMRSQVRGLKQASRNCQDGINLVQTFDGALGESHSIIRRAKELAVEAANGSYDNLVDRASIELEYKQLCQEINNIADTDFNGLCLLNGGRLASAEPNGLFCAQPTNLNWADNSFVNNTNDPDFKMTITALPELNELSLVTADEKEAMCELNGASVGVSMDNGTPVFKFNEPIPKYLSIETEGAKGIISMTCNGYVMPVAEVSVSGIDISYNCNGKGTWSSSTGGVTYYRPTSENPLNTGKTLSESTADPQSAGSDKKTAEEAMRKEYHDWLNSIPGSDKVLFKITDDRKHFKIVKGADMLRISDGSGGYINCSEDVEYDRNTRLYITTDNKNCNTSGQNYKWENWSFSVSWSEETVRPGGTLYLTTSDCSKSGSKYIYGSTPPGSGSQLYTYFSIFGISTNCVSDKTPTSHTDIHSFWELHGEYSFTFTYNVTKMSTGEGYWSASVNDGKTTKTYSENNAAEKATFNAIKNLVKADTDGTKTTIMNAHAAGYFTPSYGTRYDKQYWPPANKSSYSFTLNIYSPGTSTDYTTSWSIGSQNTAFKLGIYDPNDPDKGGIETDRVIAGTFTYKNPDFVNTVNEGYWVDENGSIVDLEALGIHLPKAYSQKVLSSDDPEYLKPYIPLHDGLSFTVKSVVSGPTGLASANVRLWQDDDNFIPLYDDDLSDMGLSYSENLILQSNSRSKDAVKFTFKYASQGMGELVCDMNCSAQGLGIDSLTLKTQDEANDAIDKLDFALNKVSMVRACFGATQNRLEKKVENITVTSENITESESYIRDADMALLMMNFTKSQILNSASQTMLLQSNLRPQQVLQLLE